MHFCASSRCFGDIKIKKIHPNSGSRARSAIFAITVTFDGKCQNLPMPPTHCCTSSCCFRDMTILFLYFQKVGKGHGVQFLQLHHSMAVSKSKNVYFCFYFRLGISCANNCNTHTHRHTHRHTHTDTHTDTHRQQRTSPWPEVNLADWPKNQPGIKFRHKLNHIFCEKFSSFEQVPEQQHHTG